MHTHTHTHLHNLGLIVHNVKVLYANCTRACACLSPQIKDSKVGIRDPTRFGIPNPRTLHCSCSDPSRSNEAYEDHRKGKPRAGSASGAKVARLSEEHLTKRHWVHVHARTHARMHVRTHARTHAPTHACTHARTHACTHAHTHAHARTHTLDHA